jgi:hypothetical protein
LRVAGASPAALNEAWLRSRWQWNRVAFEECESLRRTFQTVQKACGAVYADCFKSNAIGRVGFLTKTAVRQ